jgi:hypothetical protein
LTFTQCAELQNINVRFVPKAVIRSGEAGIEFFAHLRTALAASVALPSNSHASSAATLL